jgi:hypothetical protein
MKREPKTPNKARLDAMVDEATVLPAPRRVASASKPPGPPTAP